MTYPSGSFTINVLPKGVLLMLPESENELVPLVPSEMICVPDDAIDEIAPEMLGAEAPPAVLMILTPPRVS